MNSQAHLWAIERNIPLLTELWFPRLVVYRHFAATRLKQLLLGHQSRSLSPVRLEHETTNRLAAASAEVELPERFGQFVRSQGVSDRDRRNRFKALRHSVNLSNFLRRESRHLMHEEAERRSLHEHVAHGQSDIMEGVAVRLAGLVKVQLRN